MTSLQGIGLLAATLLVLLGRSAWRQGELVQFLRSLAVVAGVIGILTLIVATTIALDRMRM